MFDTMPYYTGGSPPNCPACLVYTLSLLFLLSWHTRYSLQIIPNNKHSSLRKFNDKLTDKTAMPIIRNNFGEQRMLHTLFDFLSVYILSISVPYIFLPTPFEHNLKLECYTD